MDELGELRQRKLEQLQGQQDEQTRLLEQISALEKVVKQLMTKEAIGRYGTLKSAHPEKALQAAVVLAQMVQTNKLSRIGDEELKNVLRQLKPQKKEFKITRR